jgi:hypothetical protein
LAVNNFAKTNLNTFNSTFNYSTLINTIVNADPSITNAEAKIQLQKKFYPNLSSPTTYTLNYNTPLQRGVLLSGVTSSPALQFQDPSNLANIIDGVYIEEIPTQSIGIDTISIVNPGFNYQSTPTIAILGDGTGANAYATLSGSGSISSITVTDAGSGYTSAIVSITPAPGDTGQGALAVAVLQGQYGTLRSYYYNSNNVKTILNSNVGTIDYTNGIVKLNSFGPLNVDNDLAQFAVTVNPTTTIISSTYNQIITVDPFDTAAITVNVTASNK